MKKGILLISSIAILLVICLKFFFYLQKSNSQNNIAALSEKDNGFQSVKIFAHDNTLVHEIRVEIEEFKPPIVVNYPGDGLMSEYSSDELLAAYIASCNPISMTYDTFVSLTTAAYREKTNRYNQADYEQQMALYKSRANSKGLDTSTKAVLLHKVLASGEFGELCFLVRLPSLMTINDLSNIRKEDYSYTLFSKVNGNWKLESPDIISKLGLQYLDYKNIDVLRDLASSKRVFLNPEKTEVLRVEK